MSNMMIDRRSILAAALALPATLVAARAQGASTAGTFRGVAIDVSPLLRFGNGGATTLLQPVLQVEMQKVFADRIVPGDPRAPVLVARISSFYLAAYDGAQRFDSFGGNDNIEGDGIVTAGRQVISTTHVLTEVPPSYSGSLITPGLDRIRYQSIAYQFAYWLRREMNI